MHSFMLCYVYRDDLARYIFNRGLYLVLLLKNGSDAACRLFTFYLDVNSLVNIV
ncbi:hypothetical protein Hanom_Chr12g01112491 [Helianthus anomalus]